MEQLNEKIDQLYLASVGDATIYRTVGRTCIQNLRRKREMGIFDEDTAFRSFEAEYLERALLGYKLITGKDIILSKEEREQFARLVYTYYEAEIKA